VVSRDRQNWLGQIQTGGPAETPNEYSWLVGHFAGRRIGHQPMKSPTASRYVWLHGQLALIANSDATRAACVARGTCGAEYLLLFAGAEPPLVLPDVPNQTDGR
jgi:hypothetical protein